MAYKKSSPAMKKKQGYNARLDDSLGAKNGKKKQSMKDRRDESEGMEKSMGKRKYSGNKSSAQGSPAKMEKTKTKDNKRKTVEKTKSVYRAPRGKHGVGRTAIVDKKKVTTDKQTGS